MPKSLITPEIAVYIKANYLKESGSSIARRFGIDKGIVYRFEKNNGLVVPAKLKKEFRLKAFLKATKGTTNFTKKEDDFIKENYLNIPVKTMANILGRSGSGINCALKRMNLVIPQKLADKRKKIGMFRKGQIPVNKGKKQTEFMSPEMIEKTKATRFKKGQKPHNALAFKKGQIVVRKDSRGVPYKRIYIEIGSWILLQNYNWENEYGPIPEGYFLRCIDGNTLNCNHTNWELITRQDHMERNTIHRYPLELKQTIRLIAKVSKKIKK